MSSIETARALSAAREKKAATETAVAALQARQQALHDQIGRGVRDGKDVAKLETDLAGVEAQLKRLVLSLAPVDTAVVEAEDAHRKEVAREHGAKLKALAGDVKAAAEKFEAALAALLPAKAGFVAAGNALEAAARAGGDPHPERFRTETLAADVIERRLFGRQNVEYAHPVPDLVAAALETLR